MLVPGVLLSGMLDALMGGLLANLIEAEGG